MTLSKLTCFMSPHLIHLNTFFNSYWRNFDIKFCHRIQLCVSQNRAEAFVQCAQGHYIDAHTTNTQGVSQFLICASSFPFLLSCNYVVVLTHGTILCCDLHKRYKISEFWSVSANVWTHQTDTEEIMPWTHRTDYSQRPTSTYILHQREMT